jgi:hypothetical protein
LVAAGIMSLGSLGAGALQAQTRLSQPSLAALAEANEIAVHPSTLNDFLEEFGRRPVRIPVSRVVDVVGTRALVVEPIGKWSDTVPWLDRVLVVVPHGTLKAAPDAIENTDVRVHGTVRTALGVQTSQDVAWPAELTRQRLDKLDVRAVILATSVETTDGVELTNQRLPVAAPRR